MHILGQFCSCCSAAGASCVDTGSFVRYHGHVGDHNQLSVCLCMHIDYWIGEPTFIVWGMFEAEAV